MKKISIISTLLVATTVGYGATWNWNPFDDEASGLSETNCSMEAQHLSWSCTLNQSGRKCQQATQRYRICRDLQDVRSEHRRNKELRKKVQAFDEWQRSQGYTDTPTIQSLRDLVNSGVCDNEYKTNTLKLIDEGQYDIKELEHEILRMCHGI